MSVRNLLIPSLSPAKIQLLAPPSVIPSSPLALWMLASFERLTCPASRRISRRRYAKPPQVIHNTVEVHVMVIHQIRTAWTQSHLEPDDSTREETEAFSIDVLGTDVGEYRTCSGKRMLNPATSASREKGKHHARQDDKCL